MKQNVRKKRYLYVAGCFVMLLLLGIAYAWSVFVGPLEETYGWTRTQTSLAFTILMIGFSVGCVMTGILAKKIGYQKIVILAAILIGGGFAGTAFATDIVVLYVTYGVFAGLGIGMIYNASISVIPRWFPESQGMITGVLLMGYALSTSILSPVCQKLLSVYGPKRTFLVLAVLDFAVFFVGSSFMKLPTEDELRKLPENVVRSSGPTTNSMNSSEMLHTSKFYIYFIASNFLFMAALSYLNHVAPALQGEMAVSAGTGALVVSAMSLCNGIARPLAGQFIDRMGVKITLRALSGINVTASILACVALIGNMTALMIIAACLLLFGYGCQGSSMPSVIRILYGEEHLSMNYSIMSIVSLTASVGPIIMGAMQVRSGNYLAGFLFMAACSIAAVPLFFTAGAEEKKWQQPIMSKMDAMKK